MQNANTMAPNYTSWNDAKSSVLWQINNQIDELLKSQKSRYTEYPVFPDAAPAQEWKQQEKINTIVQLKLNSFETFGYKLKKYVLWHSTKQPIY